MSFISFQSHWKRERKREKKEVKFLGWIGTEALSVSVSLSYPFRLPSEFIALSPKLASTLTRQSPNQPCLSSQRLILLLLLLLLLLLFLPQIAKRHANRTLSRPLSPTQRIHAYTRKSQLALFPGPITPQSLPPSVIAHTTHPGPPLHHCHSLSLSLSLLCLTSLYNASHSTRRRAASFPLRGRPPQPHSVLKASLPSPLSAQCRPSPALQPWPITLSD